jgi:hypothetical protein
MLPARRRALVGLFGRGALVLIAACVVAFLARKVFLTTDKTIVGDGQNAIGYWETARASFARGDGFPLWDRSQCGGLPFVSNPETPLVSSLFAALFGVSGDRMERWYGTLGTLVLLTGTYAWCRRVFSLHAIPAFFAGAVIATSGFVYAHFAGHPSFVPLALLPWILLLARMGEDDARAAVGAGALLGLAALEGGMYAVPYSLVALALTEGPRLFVRGRAPAVLRMGALLLVTFAMIGGAKILPGLSEYMRHPRKLAETDRQTWPELIPMFVENRHGGFPNHPYVLDEYRAYVGPLAFGFAIAGAGAALILKPRRWGGVVLLLAGLLLVRGMFSEASPYALLFKLPFFDQLRVPSRFVFLALLGIAVSAGVALEASLNVVAKGRPLLQALLLAVAVVAIADPIVAGQTCHKLWATEPMLPSTPVATTPFQLTDAHDGNRHAEYPARNVGTAVCFWKAWAYPDAQGLPIGPLPQAAVDPGAGRVTKVDVTQNGYQVEVEAARPTALKVFTTYDPDWSASVGEPRRAGNGQLEIMLPAGKHALQLRYRPLSFVLGLVATGLGLALMGAVFWLARTRRAPRAAVAKASPPSGASVAPA